MDLNATLEHTYGIDRRDVRDKIIVDVLLYLFKYWHQVDLNTSTLRNYPQWEDQVKELIKQIPNIGDILRDDKVRVFTYFCTQYPAPEAWAKRVRTQQFSAPSVKQGLKEDRRALSAPLSGAASSWIKRAVENPVLNKHLTKLRKELLLGEAQNASTDEDTCPPMDSITRVTDTEGAIVLSEDLQTYMKKFIYKKFAFVLDSYGVEKEDIQLALLSRAVYAMRMEYPTGWRAVGDLLAIAKSAIASAGANLLMYYSAECRAKMDTDNNWLEQSLDTAQDSVVYEALVFTDANMGIVNAKISIDNLIKHTPIMYKHKRRLLQLLSGRYDEEFSTYLKQRNDEYAEGTEFPRLFTRVCRFMHVDEGQAMTFLRSLSGPVTPTTGKTRGRNRKQKNKPEGGKNTAQVQT